MSQKIKIIISICFLSSVLVAFQNCGRSDGQSSDIIEESIASSELGPEDPFGEEFIASARTANTPRVGWYHHIRLNGARNRPVVNTSYYVWSSGRFCVHNDKKYGTYMGTSDPSIGAHPGFNHAVYSFFSNGLWDSRIYAGHCRY